MKYSKLKYDLEILDLQHKHEMAIFEMKHQQIRMEMLSKCTHTYEDGISARTFKGDQRESWNVCGICNKTI